MGGVVGGVVLWVEYTTGCGHHDLSVSPNPLGTKLGFELGWGSASEGLGPGLDSTKTFYFDIMYHCINFPK